MEMLGDSKVHRLVFVVFPLQGHINPMLQLATIFYSKGFSITIVHPQLKSPSPSNHPFFTFVSIPDNLSQTQVSPANFLDTIKTINENCRAPFELLMKKMLEDEDSDNQVACIIYDVAMNFAQSVANYLKLPGISVPTSAAATMLTFAAFARPEAQGYISFHESLSQGLAPEIESLKLLEILASTTTQHPTDFMLKLRANVTRALKEASGIVVNTMQFLEQDVLTKIPEYFPTSIFSIGPFHKLAPSASSSLLEEDASCISWLNKQSSKSVIFVSFGSVASISEKELIEVAWGLANSEQPFLWVVRPGLVSGLDLPELLSKIFQGKIGQRGYIVKWAPQKEVLAHSAVGGFWTHCGWNSILESVCEGVPMICRPFFGDQHLNARYVCHLWRIGLELENDEFQRDKIEKAIRRLMVEKEGEEIRQRASEFKEKAKVCLSEGGSSYNSLNDLTKHILSSHSRRLEHSPILKAT